MSASVTLGNLSINYCTSNKKKQTNAFMNTLNEDLDVQ